MQTTWGDVQRLQVGMAQKQGQVAQVQAEAQEQMRQLQLRMTELQAKINETQVLLAQAQAQLKQRLVYAPASGRILTLNVRQTGELLQAGQQLAEIAPQNQPLILSALLPSQEVGFVKVGMPVQVKLDAFPYQDYGVIAGRVSKLSLNSKPIENAGLFYQVDIALEKHAIRAKGETIKFRPGQTGTAEIVTRRRILDILLDPIKQLQGNLSL